MEHIKTWGQFNESKISSDTTFDVLGYKTKEDYKKSNFEVIDNEITIKTNAIKLALDTLDAKDFEIVKVQSEDGEFSKVYPENAVN